ncbi:oxidoreductase-like protein [Parathielavia appendiculata]|uniref:Oxidoreductase-like protein n=1 Tax=Parathielavia appendiculata TaxID=2587402 RepID=A0AAN6Z0Q4_9PEZI|nr:oxidoreductase-like protein [Parathielavia appendiculata]
MSSIPESVVPGSVNLPPAPWPPAAVTPTEAIDAGAVAEHIVASLNDALSKRDHAAVADLFLPDPGNYNVNNSLATGYWRDHLVLSWRLRTLKGPAKICAFLDERSQVPPSYCQSVGPDWLTFEVDESSGFRRPQVTDFRPAGGVTGVGFFVKVENGAFGGVGRGVVRAVEEREGVWKIWTLFTTLEGVKGMDERTGLRREIGVEHRVVEGRTNWTERRRAEREFEEGSPEVLVIGAGQAGLSAAARLKMLGISTLVTDKNKAVGDNWRKRYPQLVLHDPVWYDHLPYIPFPESWPVFTPKDKLADWLESYVKALDLNVWTGSEMTACFWDKEHKRWTVDIRRIQGEGHAEIRTMYPKHIIIATGHAGKPYMPSIPGIDSFQGGSYWHSANFPGAKENGRGKKAVVIGACNSSMDICQDYVEKGYDVTVVQRSSTLVISSDNIRKVSLGVLYEEGGPPVEDSDIAVWGWPSELLKSLQVDLTSITEERDNEMIHQLNRAGFKTDSGPSGGGIFAKYLQRGGGYYIDVGGAKLIIDGKVKVKHGQEVVEVLPRGLKFTDGSVLEADEIVFATGYENMRTMAEVLLEQELTDKVGGIWGWDQEGEMRTIWTSSGHPGLWFHGGNLAFCRYYSRLVALQILAKLKGLERQA